MPKESVEGGCVWRVLGCLQGLEFREREQPEILVLEKILFCNACFITLLN